MQINIDPTQIKKIGAYGEATYPEECCGFVIGRAQNGVFSVQHLLPAENHLTESKHNRYVISPQDYLRAEQWAESRELQLIGFYHSHPDHPAQPSQFDLDHAWPNWLYLIAEIRSGRARRINTFVLDPSRDHFNPVQMKIAQK